MQKEYLLSTDDFNRPKVLEGKAAISALLVRIILLEPGTFPTHPKMGVGLISRYRYIDQDKLNHLESDIHSQVKTYLPQFQAVDVSVEMDENNGIVIGIQVDDTLYKYETVKQENNDIGLIEFKAY